jgi:hypothetical protein
MAWTDTDEFLLVGGVTLTHCPCDGYEPPGTVAPDIADLHSACYYRQRWDWSGAR